MKNPISSLRFILAMFILFGLSGHLLAQKDHIIIQEQVRLMKDSISQVKFIYSLNSFLNEMNAQGTAGSFVLKERLLESQVMIDEMKAMSASKKHNNEHYYKPYLNNLIRVRDSVYILQISYLAVNDSMPLLRAVFTLMAEKKLGLFYFYSPLKKNTSQWKSKQINNTKLFYKNKLNYRNAEKYFNKVAAFDKKLGVKPLANLFFSADDFQEALQIVGIDYKLDYNGYAHNEMICKWKDSVIVVSGLFGSGFNEFDPHDLWHERLHQVLSTDSINRPVDEGTAYLYGGSWGFSWEEIFKRFSAFAAANPRADWISLYNEGKNFDEKSKYPLQVDYVINALLVDQIEKEKGFSSVRQLLACGKKEKGNTNYFNALERIAGIRKEEFNLKVNQLLSAKK